MNLCLGSLRVHFSDLNRKVKVYSVTYDFYFFILNNQL